MALDLFNTSFVFITAIAHEHYIAHCIAHGHCISSGNALYFFWGSIVFLLGLLLLAYNYYGRLENSVHHKYINISENISEKYRCTNISLLYRWVYRRDISYRYRCGQKLKGYIVSISYRSEIEGKYRIDIVSVRNWREISYRYRIGQKSAKKYRIDIVSVVHFAYRSCLLSVTAATGLVIWLTHTAVRGAIGSPITRPMSKFILSFIDQYSPVQQMHYSCCLWFMFQCETCGPALVSLPPLFGLYLGRWWSTHGGCAVLYLQIRVEDMWRAAQRIAHHSVGESLEQYFVTSLYNAYL
jgi:hypothetical protein